MMPQDQLVARTLEWSVEDAVLLEELAAQIPSGIARAKGIVRVGADAYLLNCVMGKTDLEKIEQRQGMEALLNKVVFIGTPEAVEQLDRVYEDSR
jgi:hypothetical protein